jgi:hypothetical protein
MDIELPAELGGMPFLAVEFDRDQRRVSDEQVTAAHDHIVRSEATDVLVVSHGWNNDAAQALTLYERLLTNIGVQRRWRLPGRDLVVLAVFWPSKRFADRDLIPGGAAELTGDVPETVLVEEIEHLRGFFDDEALDRLRGHVSRLDSSSDARRAFAAEVRDLVDPDDAEIDDELPPEFFGMDGSEMLDELGAPRDEELAAIGSDHQGGIAIVGTDRRSVPEPPTGGAAFLGSAFAGLRSGARNALNLATYYAMKKRAGDTGRRGLAPVLRELRGDAPDVRFHLVGHSFGGRLVAAAALGEDDADPSLPITSMVLLQAAFSHHGFAQDYKPGRHGYFRAVVAGERLRGPLVVTHTHNDRANTWAYPMASRLARQQAAAFGGPNDLYGAIGSNGALGTPGATFGELLSTSGEYDFGTGQVRNLEASAFIADHGAVTGPEVAHAIVSAVEEA